MSNLIKTSIKWLAAARWSLGPLSALTETLSTDPEEGLACAAMGSPHYPESKMHLRCTASGRTPLGPGLFHLAHRRRPTRNSLSAEWQPRAPRPPLWALYIKILHPDLAPTAFCFTPVSLEPFIAWHLQLRAFEGRHASARDMRHIHLCWGLSFFPQNQVPLRDMETSYSPSPSSRRGRGIQSQRPSAMHLALNTKARAHHTSMQLVLRAQTVCNWALAIGWAYFFPQLRRQENLFQDSWLLSGVFGTELGVASCYYLDLGFPIQSQAFMRTNSKYCPVECRN